MKRILLILTGGTIGSFVGMDGLKDANSKEAVPILIDNFRKGTSEFKNATFEICCPMDILSENLRISDWNTMIRCLQAIDFSKYEGIIMTHGTDTLAYTAALLHVLLKGLSIPLIMVSSQYPLKDMRTNGNENFKNAVELIKKGIVPDVYVVYENSNQVSYLHLGKDIQQCTNDTNDFYSKTMMPINEYRSLKKEQGKLLLHEITALENKVLMIEPYVGIDYESYCLEGKRVVLHGTYHSSTACTSEGESDVLEFIAKCQKYQVLFVLSPFQGSLLAQESMYISSKKMLHQGALVIADVTKEHAYGKLLVACAMYEKQEEILKCLE